MTKPKYKSLHDIALKFRKGVIGNTSSKDKCFMVAAPLCSYLRFCKYECRLIEGFVTIGEHITNHYWIELEDGMILDPTADQFNSVKGKDMPKVYIGERPDYYMNKKKKK